jgi:hypothetical protein
MPKKQLSIGNVLSDLCTKAKKEQYNILHVTYIALKKQVAAL